MPSGKTISPVCRWHDRRSSFTPPPPPVPSVPFTELCRYLETVEKQQPTQHSISTREAAPAGPVRLTKSPSSSSPSSSSPSKSDKADVAAKLLLIQRATTSHEPWTTPANESDYIDAKDCEYTRYSGSGGGRSGGGGHGGSIGDIAGQVGDNLSRGVCGDIASVAGGEIIEQWGLFDTGSAMPAAASDFTSDRVASNSTSASTYPVGIGISTASNTSRRPLMEEHAPKGPSRSRTAQGHGHGHGRYPLWHSASTHRTSGPFTKQESIIRGGSSPSAILGIGGGGEGGACTDNRMQYEPLSLERNQAEAEDEAAAALMMIKATADFGTICDDGNGDGDAELSLDNFM